MISSSMKKACDEVKEKGEERDTPIIIEDTIEEINVTLKHEVCKQTARRGVPLGQGHKNLNRKTL